MLGHVNIFFWLKCAPVHSDTTERYNIKLYDLPPVDSRNSEVRDKNYD